MAPLGIITAIIGAIRVGGPPHLKALIGRARENRASAELDFMSSTSHEVSELWNGRSIVRTMGKGKVKQILFLEGCGPPKKFGLLTLSDPEIEIYMTRKAYSDPLIDELKELRPKKTQKPWKRTSVSKSPDNNSHNNMSGGTNSEEGRFEIDGFDRAPNISLNIHPKQNRGELFVAAVLGIILQAGVIVFSAVVAYDNRFGAAVGGRPSAYAFPTLASGTAVLVIGMGICASVIGESTDECVWELKADLNATTQQAEGNHQSIYDRHSLGAESPHPIIEDSSNKTEASQTPSLRIQLSNTVSNRSARSSHSRLMTCKAQKPPIPSKQIPPYESTSKWINTLCIIGTSTGIIGFILQFEGFRGTSWVSSIAQLVAILIMTVVRAIIRRGMLDRPIDQKIPDKYEIDWLALRIGNNDNYLSDFSRSKIHPSDIPPYDPSWTVCSQMNPTVQVTFGLTPITNESIVQEIVKIRKRIYGLTAGLEARLKIPVRLEPDTSDSTIPEFHEHIKGPRAAPEALIRECLQMLTTWEKPTASWDPAKNGSTMQKYSDPAIKASAASAASAIETIMNIFKVWPDSSFHWLIDVKIGTGKDTTTQKVKLHATRKTITQNSWSVSAKGTESILSLWIYHFTYNHQRGNRARNSTENISRDIHSFQRVIGPSRSTLKRDMTWWAGIESAEALGEFSWDDEHDSESLSMGFCLPDFDHNETSKGALSQKSSYYAMITNVSKEKFLAQHIFSTFLWAVVNSLPLSEMENIHPTEVVLPRDDKLRLNEEHPNWNSLRLTNKTIKQMTKAVESSGLGTLEDANLLIIPPLSYADKLPNEGIVDIVRKKVKDNELGHRDFACKLYGGLLKLCDDLPAEGTFAYKVVSTTVDFLVTATSASETKKYMESYDGDLEKSKRMLVNILRSNHKTCVDMLQSLYAKQGRLKNFGKTGLLDDRPKYKIKTWARNEQTIVQKEVIDDITLYLDEGHTRQFLGATDILGWTPLHYAVIYSLEAVQKLVKKKKELVNDNNLRQDNAEKIIKKLLDAGAEPLKGRDDLVPLHCAVKTGNIEATILLLQWELHEKTLNFKDYSGMTPLHFAALGGNPEIMEILLKKVVSAQDLNAQNRLGRTALHVAVKGINTDGSSKRAKTIEKLTNNEASVAIKDKDNKKALDMAVEMEYEINYCRLRGRIVSEEPSHFADNLESEHQDNPDNSNDDKNQEIKIGVKRKYKNPNFLAKAGIPSKEEQLTLAIKSLLKKENLTADGEDLLLWAVENNFKTPFEFLIDSKEIAIDISQLTTNNGRSILHLAVDAESDTMVDRILERWRHSNSSSRSKPSPHINLADHQGVTALMIAASKGYEPGVKKLLAADVDIHLKDMNGRTALSWGAEIGQLGILTQLIESGLTLSNSCMTKYSPMFVAVENGRHEAIRLFLANGADSNEVDNDGNSVLCHAVICGRTECVKVLIEHGAELEKMSGMYKQTALSFAAKKGNLEKVKLLLTSGARVDAQDTDGWTPLIWALKCEHPKVVKLLLGEEVESVSSKNRYMEQLDSAMTLACNTGDEDLVEQLLHLGVSSNVQDADSGSTVLIEACRGGFLGTVKILLRDQGDVNAKNNSKETPLLLAARHGFNEITGYLLDAEASIEITNEVNETPLLLAVRYNNEIITGLLLDRRANTNIASNTGETPLLWATRNGNEDITTLLLQKGAHVNTANNSNETPLSLAVLKRNMDSIKLLLSKGADIKQEWGNYRRTCLLHAIYAEDEELVLAESKDLQGRTAFQFAAQIGALSMFKKLIKENSEGLHLIGGTFHDLQDRDLTHHASVSGPTDLISYLIDRFSSNEHNYHRRDINGWTPLHWAAQAGDWKVVQMLLEVDARSDAKVLESTKKWTPRQIASYNEHTNIVELLESSSIPDEILPPAGMSHGSLVCDGCNCRIRGIRFHCQDCEDFDFCEKCKATSDTTHPNHEFDKIGAQRETEPEQEVSPQQENGLMQDDSSSENQSLYEDSVKDDVAF
ncbi:uncharacterized protein EAE97_007425 [Botrytis byssoidea]|uniref:ZZ-type domain-containing protein n=1 Tax=Botrytis byssoidea TaxID=139641 RepID=A0A9P5IKD1_9HELO|nr:uncharacterized protein EAE97_007425 [Botrytis byssoidea]KAF7939345.1 hypothetical protein EAE97_007425 [Botrytis byssoidea]